jgi:hypothetical protein
MKKLFIGNLPGDALLIDIHAFLGELKLEADFRTLRGRDCHRKSYHYVVASLNNNEDIGQLISQYDKLSFKGQPLVVREYIDRMPCPDLPAEQDRRINAH